MKYLAILLFAFVAVNAQEIEDEIIIDSQAAQFMPMNPMRPMTISRNQFPIDYSMGCSGSCGCVQRCMIIWWMPCNCWCPPPCGTTNLPGVTSPTTTSTSTTTTVTTTSTTTETTTTTRSNGGCCCPPGCSCRPCTIWWMCPPRCPGSCCSNTPCNPCNTPPPPPPPCCSCPPCLPWTPCNPCACQNPCTPTEAPVVKKPEPEDDRRFPNLRDRLSGMEIVVPRQPAPEPIPNDRPWRQPAPEPEPDNRPWRMW